MNILQPIKQSKRQFIIVGLITVLLIMACFTTACFGTANDDGLPKLEHTPAPTPELPESTPLPPPSTPTPRKDAYAYGPYGAGFGGWSGDTLADSEWVMDMIVRIPVKKEPLHVYYPVLDVEYSKIKAETVEKIAKHLLGYDYMQNESSTVEYISLKSKDETAGLSVWHESDQYTQLRYYSNDYYYEPVKILEQTLENKHIYSIELEMANDFIKMISDRFGLNQIFEGKEIPKELVQSDQIDAEKLEDCTIIRFAPIYWYTKYDYDEIIIYNPVTTVTTIEERIQKMTSSYYDPANPLTSEYIDIVIKDYEIVNVVWNGYSEVTKTTKYDSIISYDEAYDIFYEKIMNSSIFKSEITNYYDVLITDIEFGLVRVGNQMIPAYTFMGTQRSATDGLETVDYDKTDVASFMIINAIDGSIVRESDMSKK